MKIFAIETGQVQIKTRQLRARRESRPARVVDVLMDRKWTERLPMGCYAIEHSDGLIVVDTGENSHVNDSGYDPGGTSSHGPPRACG